MRNKSAWHCRTTTLLWTGFRLARWNGDLIREPIKADVSWRGARFYCPFLSRRICISSLTLMKHLIQASTPLQQRQSYRSIFARVATRSLRLWRVVAHATTVESLVSASRVENSPPKGVMLIDRAVSIHEITDGTSQTLIVAEDSRWPEGQWINGRNIFDQAFGINQAPEFENDIRSEHPRGANGAFCDGSVRFLSESMDLQVLAAICTRNRGEVFSE